MLQDILSGNFSDFGVPTIGDLMNNPIMDAEPADPTLDDRANALAQAINQTGVQSLQNPCTIAGWYVASGVGAVAVADVAGAGEIGQAGNTMRASQAGSVFGKAKWWLGAAGLWATVQGYTEQAWNWTKGQVQGGCNTMQ